MTPIPTRATVAEVIGLAVDGHDPRLASDLVDFLRFRRGLSYAQILDAVQQVRPDCSPEDWDQLLAEADQLQSKGQL